jgi:hypothetical protein
MCRGSSPCSGRAERRSLPERRGSGLGTRLPEPVGRDRSYPRLLTRAPPSAGSCVRSEGFVGAHPRPPFALAVATLAGRVPRASDGKRAPWRVRGRRGCASWGRLAKDRYSERAGAARVSAPGRPSALRSSRALAPSRYRRVRAPWLGVGQLRAAAGHPGARPRNSERSRRPVHGSQFDSSKKLATSSAAKG